MPRRPRIEFPGAIYHVLARGAVGQSIYRDSWDRDGFVALLGNAVSTWGWRCHGYCLMSTHYHLLVETPEPNLSQGMHGLNGTYARTFNRRHARNGHVFESRYKAKLVETDTYLLELVRYLALNPVRAGMCREPDEWQWSSYRALVGLELDSRPVRLDWVLGQFGSDGRTAVERLRAFVEDGKSRPRLPR